MRNANFVHGCAKLSIKIFCLLLTYIIFILTFNLNKHALSLGVIDEAIERIRLLAALISLSSGFNIDVIERILIPISFFSFLYLYILLHKFLNLKDGVSVSGSS